MNIKDLLKPSWRKIALTIILFALVLFLSISYYFGGGFTLGFPFHPIGPIMYNNILETTLILIMDLIFWYLISCLIVWSYEKVRKK